MKSFFLDPQSYDGSQLRSHWIYQTTRLQGDALVSFIGPCQVDLSHMVDWEDVVNQKPIFSEKMLHFLVEHFENDLEKMVLRQRLLMVIMQEELQTILKNEMITRKGDDLYMGEAKLTVSIATASPVSCLIHAGINISSRNTPVLTKGLEDLEVDPHFFAMHVMERYVHEMESVRWARCKVRAVC